MDDHFFFMGEALQMAGEALVADEFPVGCVIVSDGRIISTGRRQNSSGEYCEIDHAEIVALRNLAIDDRPYAMDELTVYSTMEPCLMCFSTLLVSGIRKFVYGYEDAMGGGTNLPLNSLSPLYREMHVSVIGGVRRSECLQQFKTFFSSDTNLYLKDSYLARYTLEQ